MVGASKWRQIRLLVWKNYVLQVSMIRAMSILIIPVFVCDGELFKGKIFLGRESFPKEKVMSFPNSYFFPSLCFFLVSLQKRRPFGSAVEIILPIFFFLVLLSVRKVVKSTPYASRKSNRRSELWGDERGKLKKSRGSDRPFHRFGRRKKLWHQLGTRVFLSSLLPHSPP